MFNSSDATSRLPHDLTFAKLGNDLALSAKLYQQNRYKSLEYKGSLIKPEKKKETFSKFGKASLFYSERGTC